jgi:hypothetical protein
MIMRHTLAVFTTMVLVAALTMPLAAYAETPVVVPAGTRVPLTFLTRVDSRTARQGASIRFRVAADVIVRREVVIRAGTLAQGLIVAVVPPGSFGRDARIRVAFIRTRAADGRLVPLAPLVITAGRVRTVRDTGGAAVSSGVGLILLGPLGLAAGALVHGGVVVVPRGAVVVAATTAAVRVAGVVR